MKPPTSAPSIPPRRRARRLVHRHRRVLACLLLSAAAGVVVEGVVGEDTATTPVLVAARDLPVGSVLSNADLTVVELPQGASDWGSFTTPAQAVGQYLASPLSEGSPVATTSLAGEGLLTGTPPGTVAVPVRPVDPSTVQLLAPGQRVDVILSTGNGYDVASESTVVARSVPVLWTQPDGGGDWPGSDGDSGLVVVAADADEAAALAGASSSGDVHLVLTSGS